jgi:hypothetical protein
MKKLLFGSLLAGACLLPLTLPATATTAGDVIVIMNADGTLEFGQNVTSTTLLSTGNYEIITKVKIIKCAAVATLGNPTDFGVSNGTVTVVQRSGSLGKGYFVQTFNTSGALTNIPFTLYGGCRA